MQNMLHPLTQRLIHYRHGLTALVLPLTLILAGCQTPEPPAPAPVVKAPVKYTAPVPAVNTAELAKQATLRNLVVLQDRLFRVTAPILVNNAALCRKSTRNLIGFTAKNKYSYPSELIDSAQTILGLGEQLQIMGVMAGGGAANAGVQAGDKLVAVDGVPIPQGPNAEHQASTILVPLLTEHTSFTLTVNRGGIDLSMKVPLTRACAFFVELGNTDSVDALDDGHRIMVTRGMMNFASKDEDLVYILTSEIAHNVLGHALKQRMNTVTSKVIDNLVRIHPDNNINVDHWLKPSTLDLDISADKLGLYMAARAGYSVDNARAFWTRLGRQVPLGDSESYTSLHQINGSLLAAIDHAASEIKGKQIARKALMP